MRRLTTALATARAARRPAAWARNLFHRADSEATKDADAGPASDPSPSGRRPLPPPLAPPPTGRLWPWRQWGVPATAAELDADGWTDGEDEAKAQTDAPPAVVDAPLAVDTPPLPPSSEDDDSVTVVPEDDYVLLSAALDETLDADVGELVAATSSDDDIEKEAAEFHRPVTRAPGRCRRRPTVTEAGSWHGRAAATELVRLLAGSTPPSRHRLQELVSIAPTPEAASDLVSLALAAGAPPAVSTFVALASRFADAGQPMNVRRVAAAAERAGLRRLPPLTTLEVRAHAVDGDIPTACSVLGKLLDIAAAAIKRTQSGRDGVAATAAAAAASAASHAADAGARALIVACGRAGRAADGAGVMKDLKAAGVTPSLETHTALVGAWAEPGNGRAADAAAAAATADGHAPSHVTRALLLRAWSRSGNVAKTEAALADLADATEGGTAALGDEAWGALIAVHARRGDVPAAKAAFDRAVAAGCTPGPRCYGRLMDAHGEAGDPDAAAAVLREAAAAGCPPGAHEYALAVHWYAVRGDGPAAAALLRGAGGGGVRVSASRVLLKEAAEAWGEAWWRARARGATDPAPPRALPAGRLRAADPAPPRALPAGRLLAAAVRAGARYLALAPPFTRLPPPASGKPLWVDIHYAGHWTAQLALADVLRRLAKVRATPAKAAPAGGARAGGAPPTPSPLPDLHIITGRGNRSRRGGPVVRNAAIGFLQAAGLEVRMGNNNDGMLIVRGGGVERLVDQAASVGLPVNAVGLVAAFVGR